jgi:hypothetical protein
MDTMNDPMLYEVRKAVPDQRIGGIVRYHYIGNDARELMRIPPEILKCVAFLGYRQLDRKEILLGTVFFVAVPLPRRFYEPVLYAVTAKHNIDKIKAKAEENASDGNVYFRMNSSHSSLQRFFNKIEDWHFHPDPTVDVAVCTMWFNGANHMAFPLEGFITDEAIEKNEIGIGEDLFIPGLFLRHYRTSQNVPIIRTGNIAAMPGEPVRGAKNFGLVEGYLIEVRSLGGLSGSPVFINLGTYRYCQGAWKTSQNPQGTYYLLGLVHGHYDLPMDTPIDWHGIEDFNLGIAIVVPAQKILETLGLPQLLEAREKYAKELDEEGAATLDNLDKDNKARL